MEHIKKIYAGLPDNIYGKRFNSPYALRRYVHRKEYYSILNFISGGGRVLDIGCGEGVLSLLLAERGARVTGCDISEPNIKNAAKIARVFNPDLDVKFEVADAEDLPYGDNSFDVVVSSHVLEHLRDIQKGLQEIKRVMKKRAVIAMPTNMNLCAACLLGGDNFWRISRKTPYAMLVGMAKIIINILKDGVNESYSGHKELPHLWRYPWVMKRLLKQAGFKIIHFEASSICLPYVNAFLPIIKFMDSYKGSFLLRNFGYGSIAVVEKK